MVHGTCDFLEGLVPKFWAVLRHEGAGPLRHGDAEVHTERVAVLREGFQSEQRIGRPTVAPGALGPAVE